MKSYWILDTVAEVEQSQNASTTALQAETEKKYFYGCIDKQINGKTFVLVPLSEISRVFEINLKYFMDDAMLDVLNQLKKKHGYFPILSLDEND